MITKIKSTLNVKNLVEAHEGEAFFVIEICSIRRDFSRLIEQNQFCIMVDSTT